VKIKLDENLDARLTALFAERGHDVETVRNEGLGGAADARVFDVCRTEGRVLVTLDLDFANPLRFPPGTTEGVVVLRPSRPVIPLIDRLLRDAIPALDTHTLRGVLWVVEPGRIRIYDPNESNH
jgi:predicted nuclease of predicted toxin-antitoxin system